MFVAAFAVVVQFVFRFLYWFFDGGDNEFDKYQNHYEANNYWQRPIIFLHE